MLPHNTQDRCQLVNIARKAVRHHNNWTNNLNHNPNPIKYAENLIETYAEEVTRRLNGMIKFDNGLYVATKYLVSINIINESIDKLAYSQCAKNKVGDSEERILQKFREFVGNDGINTATNDLIDRFMEF